MPEEVVVQSIRESALTHSESPLTHFVKRERYGRTPDSVARDARLTLEAKAVYGALARHAFKAGNVYIGQRRLAEYLQTSQKNVSRRIQELLKCGHIRLSEPTARGHRAGYQLQSNLFAPREKKPAVSGDSRKRPTVRSAARMWAEDCASREVS